MDRLTEAPPGFRPVPRTGVIYVMTEAQRLGYRAGSPEWSNLGQGAPETGPLEGSPPRLSNITLPSDSFEYAPIDGLPELRDAVAELYNSRYRKGMASQYTRENVAIGPGGRAGGDLRPPGSDLGQLPQRPVALLLEEHAMGVQRGQGQPDP